MCCHAPSPPNHCRGLGQVFGVRVGVDPPDWRQALVVSLNKEHFSPSESPISDESLAMAVNANPMTICVNLRAGSDARISTFVTWNCSSLQRHGKEVIALCADFVCRQETGLTSRAQVRMQHEFQQEGYSLVCSGPSPITQQKEGWRADRGSVPGVAIAARSACTSKGPTRKTRHASVFSTHSDTQAL